MLLVAGFLIVFVSTIGGFMVAGGQPLVLLHLSEFLVIFGIALGILVIASPVSTLRTLVAKMFAALKGAAAKPGDFTDLLKLLFELFTQARRGGLIAIEEDIASPRESHILSRYPSLLNDPDRLDFLCNSLKPVIDGRVKPEQLSTLLAADIDAREDYAERPVHLLHLIGDSLPGIGIIAAVLGIINTMAALDGGPEAVGEKVAAALTGTFLGIFAAYGFVNPVASRIKSNNHMEMQYYGAIKKAVGAFIGGMAPVMAVETARRSLDRSVQPSAETLDTMIRQLGTTPAT